MRPFSETFAGWPYVDIPVERADEMAQLLHRERAAYASTCEAGEHRRRFYLPPHALKVVQERWSAEPRFDFDQLPPLKDATVDERVALLRWREDAVRAARAGAPTDAVLLPD